MNIIKEVKAAWVAREIKRLLPKISNKAEPVVQRRNPARDVKRRKGKVCQHSNGVTSPR